MAFDGFVTWAPIYTTTYDYVIYVKWNQAKRVEAKIRCNKDNLTQVFMYIFVCVVYFKKNSTYLHTIRVLFLCFQW